MAVSTSYKSFVVEQLGRVLPDVRVRSMFGGVGVYGGELFFALIDNDALYFKVDDETRANFEARGMGPFRPFGDGGEVMKYYEVPAEVIEDQDTLQAWVHDALAVARRARVRRPRRVK